MLEGELKSAIISALPDATVNVEMQGNHAHLVVVSSAFEGLSPVKKQQLVYAAVNESIASGAVHAVHMKTLTPAQWESQQ